MLSNSVLQDSWRDVAEMACRDGEDCVADERMGLGKRKYLVTARHMEYLSPVPLEVLYEMNARSTVLCTRREEGDDSDCTEN